MGPMETDARELMTELREDHRNMTVVLDLMSGLVEQMEDEGVVGAGPQPA